MSRIAADLNQTIYISSSIDEIDGRAPDEIQEAYIQAIDPQARGDLVDYLPIFVGMQCIVTVNVNTQWSIANGSRGTIYAIGLDPREVILSNDEVWRLTFLQISCGSNHYSPENCASQSSTFISSH